MTAMQADAGGGAYVRAGDLDVWYTEHGRGQPLILVHGGLATGEVMWNARVVADLASRYRVLVPDSRGHGRTGNPAGVLRYDQMADDVAAFAATLGLRRPLVVGYSDGAQVALELGLRHPSLATALVIGGVVIRPSDAYLDALRGMGFPSRGAVDLPAVQASMGGFWDTIRTVHQAAQDDAGLSAYLSQISDLWYGVPEYTDAQLASVADPALVITGDRDGASVDDSVRLYRLLPRGELAVLPNADHGAGERPLFWELVKDFLTRHAHEETTTDG
jgi:pimeloyl-ACP methyl ester carboxylesterase